MACSTTPVATELVVPEGASIATFAGGCFWCTEAFFQEQEGVLDVVSGYAGGSEEEASYRLVAGGMSDHRESIQLSYDPEVVTYEQLLEWFWQQIDPTDEGGQFYDRGFQYSTAIFYHDEAQQAAAEASKRELEESGRFEEPIVTEILPFTTFFAAEEYHQDFYKNSADHYKRYKEASGRDQFVEENWAKEAALEHSR